MTSIPRAPPDTTASPPRAVAWRQDLSEGDRRGVDVARTDDRDASPAEAGRVAATEQHRRRVRPEAIAQTLRVGIIRDGDDPDPAGTQAIEFERELSATREQARDPLRFVGTDIEGPIDLLGREVREVSGSLE